MSIYQKASLVQIPSGYKASGAKLYSVLPANGDGDFTVSADADATRIDENGLIESTAANQARLSRNFIDGVVQPDPHLLLEPTRTNLMQRSEEFDNSYWTKARASITANQTTSPDGSNTADKLIDSTDNNTHILYRSFTVSTSNAYTFSCFIKKGSLSKAFLAFDAAIGQTVVFDLENGTVESEGIGVTSSSIIEYANDWYKCSLTHTPTTTTRLYRVGTYNGSISYTGTGTDFVYLWGAQLEEGSYLSSYVKTEASAVTRTVDTCGTSDTNLINNTEGVLFVDFEFSEQGTTSLYQIPIGLYNSGGSGSQRITIDNYSGKLRIYVVSPSGTRTVWDTSKSISNVVANQRYKVAIRYKDGDCVSYVNGELYKADGGSVSGFDLVKMVFGYANFGNTLMHRGKIYQAMYFNTALTNAELQTLTS